MADNVLLKSIKNDRKAKKYIKKLYRISFPPEERAPFYLLSRKARLKNVDWLGIYDKEQCIGFFYILNYLDLSYVFYFAIDYNMRGRGYGTKALAELKNQYQNRRLFLAIEQTEKNAPNYDERVKRKNFYARSGLTAIGGKVREGNVIYELIGTGGSVKKEEYHLLIHSWTGKLMSKMVVMELID